ncbi:MAG: hypothetical protein JSU95_10000 [Betaproteobacteria bacterium]|nr:MAG: hypothetical protein JSU95_10000 [Betaproteobacteria bacterium]
MTDSPMMLKVGLILTIVIDLVYGVMFLLAPTFYFALAGSDPFDAGLLRWSGGVLIALGVGAFQVLKAPARQRIFVDTLLLSYLLAALAHTYGFFMEQYTGQIWVLGMPMVGVWITTIVLFLGRNQARELLQ